MKPIFIGGCDRSGTTMLGAMLGSHPRGGVVPELHLKQSLLCKAGGAACLPLSSARELIGMSTDVRIWDLGRSSSELTCDMADPLPVADVVRSLVRRYFEKNGSELPEFWVDHTPVNLATAMRLVKAFPKAQFVHIVRDGRAIVASVLPLDWGPNTIVAGARWWAMKMSFALAAEQWLGDRCHRVHYEDLVRDPERALSKLCGQLGLDFDPSMICGEKFAVPAVTKRQHRLVGHAPDASRIDAWQSKLSKRQIELFELLTFDLLPMLGYELRADCRARWPSAQERFRSEVGDLLRTFVTNGPLRRLRLRRGLRQAGDRSSS